MSDTSSASAPTAKQLAYLRTLADRTPTTFTTPKTRVAASRQIQALRARPREDFSRRVEADQGDPAPYATAVQQHELAGRGSSRRWAHKPARDPEDPASACEQLARYTLSSGERVLCRQDARLIDAPLDGQGRSYTVELDAEIDGEQALAALIADCPVSRKWHKSRGLKVGLLG